MFGVPLGAMFDPCAFSFAVEDAVALSVNEPFGRLIFISFYVVCLECSSVEVFVRVSEHWACTVLAFGAVDEVE